MEAPPGFGAAPFEANEPDGLQLEVQHANLTLPPDRCRQLLEYVAEKEGSLLSRVTLVLADHDTVLDLNRRFLNHDAHTDVLAFDYSETEDADVIKGEIYVDLDTAKERCREFDASFEEEALRYAVHGLLHLIGYSDKTDAGKRQMRALEDRYLDVQP